MSKGGVILVQYVQYVPAFGLNTGKYGPEKTPYLDTFYALLELDEGLIRRKYNNHAKPLSLIFTGRTLF